MAAKILYDNIKPETHSLSPESLLVVTTGPLTGMDAPSSSRFNVSARSPLTGYIAYYSCGVDFDIYLKRAGW